jgi:hypothetical protein
MAELIQSCGEVPKPRMWPMKSMREYGTIPGKEESLFRIVYAPSIYYLVGGEFTNPDGGVEFAGYLPRPRYDYIGEKWILEKWVSAKEFTGQTEVEYRAQWEDPRTHLCLTGPYPRDGEYQWVWTFNNSEQIGAAGIVAALVNKAKYNSKSANAQAIREMQAKEKKDRFSRNFDKMKDSARAFGIRSANLGGMVKAQKSRPGLMDARALGLPVRGVRAIKPSVGEMTVAGY